MIEVTILGADEAAAALEGRGEAIIGALRRKIDELDLRLQAEIQGVALSGAILQQRTGGLKNSVRAIPAVDEGNVLTGVVEAGGTGRGGAPWAQLLEFGSANAGTYPIVPKRENGWLHFIGRGGEDVFARLVNHPYMRAFHFMGRSLDEFAPQMVAGLAAAATAAAEGA